MIYTRATSGGVFRGLRVSAWVTMRESVRRDGGLKDGKQTRASDKHPHPMSSRSWCVCTCVCVQFTVRPSHPGHIWRSVTSSRLCLFSPSPFGHFSFFSLPDSKGDAFPYPRTHAEKKVNSSCRQSLMQTLWRLCSFELGPRQINEHNKLPFFSVALIGSVLP